MGGGEVGPSDSATRCVGWLALSSVFKNTERLVLRQHAYSYEVLYLLWMLTLGWEPRSGGSSVSGLVAFDFWRSVVAVGG